MIRPPRGMPQSDVERRWHEAYWAQAEELARIRRLVATAAARLDGGDVAGAQLELDCITR